MDVLAIDVGGTNVKLLASGHETRRKFTSGSKMTAKAMVNEARKAAADWKFDVVSIGYPGPVLDGRILAEPHNLGKGWAGFNFEKAFNCPVKVINDAAMQALGSYKGGRMLFLGLGTGLGSAMVIDGELEPMELGHLPYRKATYEDYIGLRGLQRFGKKKWREYVEDIVARFVHAMEPDDVVLGGAQVKVLKHLPPHCRAGNNANAFLGGFRLWDKASPSKPAPPPKPRTSSQRVNGSALKGKAAQAGA